MPLQDKNRLYRTESETVIQKGAMYSAASR